MIEKIKQFYLESSPSKMLAFICSGNEVMIETGILELVDDITGSPASAVSLRNALKAIGKDSALYHGLGDPDNDEKVRAIGYTFNDRPLIVSGRNPDASPWFVSQISKTWFNYSEVFSVSGDGTSASSLATPYFAKGFTPVKHLRQLTDLASVLNIDYKGISIAVSETHSAHINDQSTGIAVGPGPDALELARLLKIYPRSQILCPSWCKLVNAFTYPPIVPIFQVNCTGSFDVFNSSGNLIVPGGIFSTNGVLRNDDSVNGLISKIRGNLTFIGTGMELLVSSLLSFNNKSSHDE